MKKLSVMIILVALLLTACGNRREAEKEALRQEVRKQFFASELVKAQRQLARTDSLLQLAEADADTFNVAKRILLDSLKLEADVQGAKIRYIHKKQKEMQ
ncbi:MAG: hypothetical protein J5954_09660 [Prevotella sp.]|jgi:hypothetical protein|nr:hypothetical protein [Prevotella sp.]